MVRFGMFLWRQARSKNAQGGVMSALSSDDSQPLVADDGAMLEVYDG